LVAYLSFFGGERKKKKHETLVSKIFGEKKKRRLVVKGNSLEKDQPFVFGPLILLPHLKDLDMLPS
jgi:hypothetical protein